MKKYTRLLLAVAALSSAAFAQTSPAPAPADAAKLTLAREVITAMHADKMFDGMAAQMKQMATQMAGSSLPADATPAQRAAADALQGKIMDLSMNSAKELVAQMDQIYVTVYSEAELKAMKAFFLSPEGQSMLAKQPEVMKHLMPLVQNMQRDLMPKIQQLVEATKAEEAKAAAPAAAPATPPPAK